MSKKILSELIYAKKPLPNFYYCKMVAKVTQEEVAVFDLITIADNMDEALEEFRSIVKKDIYNKHGSFVLNKNIAIKDIMTRDFKEIVRHYFQNKKLNKYKEKNDLIDCIIATKDKRLFDANIKVFTKQEKKLIENNLINKDGNSNQ